MRNIIRTGSSKLWIVALLATCSVVAIAYRAANRPDPVMEQFINRIESIPDGNGLDLVDNHDGSVSITSREITVPHTMTFTADHALLSVKSDRSEGVGDFMFVCFKHPIIGPLATKGILKKTFHQDGDFRVIEFTVPNNADLTMLDQANTN